MQEKFRYLPQNERKKILLLCDDIRLHSGVAHIAKEIVVNTAQHFNWVNVGAALNHPEQGKMFDLSEDINKNTGLNDSSVKVLANSGYGNPDLIRALINGEKPDALFIITDPRYYTWLFQVENEIRKQIPIIYLNIWDDLPAPMYNRPYYESVDALYAISRQTKFINEYVLGEKASEKLISYVPHGLDHKVFKPLDSADKTLNAFRKELFGGKDYDYVVMFNSRNIRRKSIPDLILAYKYFVDKLEPTKRDDVALLLHTQPVDGNGTDLPAVINALLGKGYNVHFTNKMYNPAEMNLLYNCVDVVALLSSNEGWGLALTEALLSGTPIIANVTGGMQDQMRFTDEKGKWYTPSKEVPSNHTGKYIKHGEWAFPVFPSNRSLQGSPPTPYIWDDRVNAEDAGQRILDVFELSPEERKAVGAKGREWATGDEARFTAEKMAEKVITLTDELLDNWKPRNSFELIKVGDIDNTIDHELFY